MRIRSILIIIVVLLSTGCKQGGIRTITPEINRIRVAPVSARAVSVPIHSNGVLVSSEESKLSFKTGGIVAKIVVKEGDRVVKGDLLASLNLSEISAQTEQAKNGYEKALRDFYRAENLYKDSVATLEQKQNAATALNLAKSAQEIAQFNLAHSAIVAPANGIILRQFVKTNELVSSGYPAFLFGTSGKYWRIKAGFSDKDVVKINRGDSADAVFDAWPGMKFKAVVDQISEISNPFTGTYEIELILQKTTQRLASGFVASVNVYPSGKELFSLIPVASIIEADGHQGYIFIVTKSMSVEKVKINIETLIGSDAAVTGIPEGTKEVASEGVAYLKNGMRVEVVR